LGRRRRRDGGGVPLLRGGLLRAHRHHRRARRLRGPHVGTHPRTHVPQPRRPRGPLQVRHRQGPQVRRCVCVYVCPHSSDALPPLVAPSAPSSPATAASATAGASRGGGSCTGPLRSRAAVVSRGQCVVPDLDGWLLGFRCSIGHAISSNGLWALAVAPLTNRIMNVLLLPTGIK
jgi:hypothetical protein